MWKNRHLGACGHSPEMFGINMLSFERKLQEQIWSVHYSFKDSLKILNWCNNQMDLITQRNQQASPEGPANHVCEIWSEIKDIKYSKVPWTETVIKLNLCQKWGEGANTSIFFVTNEQLSCTFNADIVIIYLKTELVLKSRNSIYPAVIIIFVW